MSVVDVNPPSVTVTIGNSSVNFTAGAQIAKDNVNINPQSIKTTIISPVLDVSTGTQIARDYSGDLPAYTGGYSVTPSEETQVLQTKNKRMTDNVTVAPIPSNYGRITWDGTVITVS